MSFNQFIMEIKGNQAQFQRFCNIVEAAVLFYLLFAGLWSLCHIVSAIFAGMGVA